MEIADTNFGPAGEELAELGADAMPDSAADGDAALAASAGALLEDDVRPPGDEYSTDVYADVMRSVPLLSREEEEMLGKGVFDSRVAMSRALAKIPLASVVLVSRFREVEQGERPRTDVFFSPFQRDPDPEEDEGSRKADDPKASGALRAVWRQRGESLAARLDDWRGARGRSRATRAAKRLSNAFLALEPGFVILREALEKCRSLDKRVAAIESNHGIFYAELLDATIADPIKGESSKRKAFRTSRQQLCAIEREAGVDLTTLRDCTRAAASAHAEYRNARARMVSANLKLAHYLAYGVTGHGVAVEDLVQEAMIGLMRAVDRFDYRLGYKFSTYAFHWIRQTTMLAIAESSRTVRVTPHMHDRIRRLRKLAGVLEQRFGRIPTPAELIEASGLTPAQVGLARDAALTPASFDAPLFNLEDSNLHGLIEDPAQLDPSVAAEDALLSRRVTKLLDTLPPREAFILRLRHGIGVRAPHTLEEIGARLGITRERTRQLEALAMTKLRQHLSVEDAENSRSDPRRQSK